MSDTRGEAAPTPDLADALKGLGASGRASVSAARDAGRALRGLVLADLALARSAFGHGLAWAVLALAFASTAWLLLMAALAAALHALGLSWLAAFACCAVLSLAATGLAAWRALAAFEHTRLQATRRQLARLGIDLQATDANAAPGADAP